MRWRRVPVLFFRAGRKFLSDNCFHLAAAVAYYVLLSLFPLILALVSLVGFVVSGTGLEERVAEEVAKFFPVSQDLILETVWGIVATRGATGMLALVALIWAATGVFSALTQALNAAWDVPSSRSLWRQKLVDLAMLGWVGLLVTVSVVASSTVALVRRFELPLWSQLVAATGWLIDWGLALAPLLLSFASIWILYHVVPHAQTRWRDLWLGAALAALGLEAGKHFFVWYLGSFASYNAIYGPLSAVIAFLAWGYWSAAIILFGAEVASEYPRAMA